MPGINLSRLFLRNEKHSFLGISLRAAGRALVHLPGGFECNRLVTPVVLYPHCGSKRAKAHEETDCIPGYHLAHLGSLCDLCCETPWFLGSGAFRFHLGCRVLVG
jgi:hypothetical protein